MENLNLKIKIDGQGLLAKKAIIKPVSKSDTEVVVKIPRGSFPKVFLYAETDEGHVLSVPPVLRTVGIKKDTLIYKNANEINGILIID